MYGVYSLRGGGRTGGRSGSVGVLGVEEGDGGGDISGTLTPFVAAVGGEGVKVAGVDVVAGIGDVDVASYGVDGYAVWSFYLSEFLCAFPVRLFDGHGRRVDAAEHRCGGHRVIAE